MRTAKPLLGAIRLLIATLGFAGYSVAAEPVVKPRARDLGTPFDGTPGRYNAITDVAGVEVGHVTLISGSGPLRVGIGPVRTGVTAILPRGKASRARSVGAVVALNGNGELTGSHWVNESGLLETPILITNTHSVGVVRDAVISWGNRHFPAAPGQEEAFSLPVVAETYNGTLNDINGMHVRPEHVFQALDTARGGPVPEGNVGGGTGMICAEFKGGIGTASRLVQTPAGKFTVGVLVQANYGRRTDLRIAGIPIGREITDLLPRWSARPAGLDSDRRKDGSIIIVLGTDAPLLPHQLQRVLRRVALGLGRLGSVAYNSSGDIFVGFGPQQPVPGPGGLEVWRALGNDQLDPLLQAAVQATEESIVNALVAAETMVGVDGHTAYALPHDQLRGLLLKYNRSTLAKPPTAKIPNLSPGPAP